MSKNIFLHITRLKKNNKRKQPARKTLYEKSFCTSSPFQKILENCTIRLDYKRKQLERPPRGISQTYLNDVCLEYAILLSNGCQRPVWNLQWYVVQITYKDNVQFIIFLYIVNYGSFCLSQCPCQFVVSSVNMFSYNSSPDLLQLLLLDAFRLFHLIFSIFITPTKPQTKINLA